jgi:hypothetical protein
MLSSSDHVDGGCCFVYGLVERAMWTDSHLTGLAAMIEQLVGFILVINATIHTLQTL